MNYDYTTGGLFKILGFDQPKLANLTMLGEWLKTHYIENLSEKERMCHARELDEFYEGRGEDIMQDVIAKAFGDEKNRARRLLIEQAGLTKFNNFIGRVAQEKATVYSEPARRKVADAGENDRYQTFLDAVDMDGTMRELDRKLAFHEDALLWYRVRVRPDMVREPVLEVVSPASFWAICHPDDRTLLIGVIFDQRKPMADPSAPAYRVWTHDQTFVMNAKCEIFEISVEEWTLGTMPGVLCSTRKPGAKCSLLAKCPSADLLSAQKAIRLQDLGMSKESISANKQTYISGDVSNAVMGQTADSESEVVLPEGVTATTLDRGVDPAIYRDNGDYIADSAAANHGLPPSVLHQRDATSGAEIELRRIPIRELRKQRIPVMRRVEFAIANVISLVNSEHDTYKIDPETGTPELITIAGDLQEMSFTMNGWSIDFGEVQQPMTAAEEDQIYENRKRLQLTDPYEEEMRRNPDILSVADAKKIVDERIHRNTEFVTSQKDLMAASGQLGASQPLTPFDANRGLPPVNPDNGGKLGSVASS